MDVKYAFQSQQEMETTKENYKYLPRDFCSQLTLTQYAQIPENNPVTLL